MYVEIGSDAIICTDDVIGIFDLDKTTVFKVNRNYLSNVEKKGKIVTASEKLPKSFIVCDENGKESVYISQFSPLTILKRGEYVR